MNSKPITSRQRVGTALGHKTPDRVPVDFLATPEIWDRLVDTMHIELDKPSDADYYDPAWEAVLQNLEVCCGPC